MMTISGNETTEGQENGPGLCNIEGGERWANVVSQPRLDF
jgi:hypothetical protein